MIASGRAASFKYALHLEENHHSLYYGDEEGTRMLFWQSDGQQPITFAGMIRLSPIRRQQWKELLDTALNMYRDPISAGR